MSGRAIGMVRGRLVIAIDGPAGAGKSTAARGLAAALGYLYVDSGAMYRAVGLAARERGLDAGDTAALAALVHELDVAMHASAEGVRVLLDGRDVTTRLRDRDAGEWASRVATVPTVREALVARQRALAAGGGIVMEGRDIGTVVLPDADCKFFLTASAEERARRRHDELDAGDAAHALADTRAELEARDRRDRERAHSPLKPAADAITIDTSALAPTAVVARMLEVACALARP